jgi:hypothetical protein
MKFIERVSLIIANLNAPKSQFNAFGKYKYRNCEDILSAVKPLLNGLILNISDEVTVVDNRVYVVATAKLTDGTESIQSKAFAREPLSKKGMDESQITGAASSYARKYALNGLLCIDDTQDADSKNNTNVKARNYVEENEIKDNMRELLGELTEGLTVPEKTSFIRSELGIKSFKELDTRNSSELKDMEKRLIEIKNKR